MICASLALLQIMFSVHPRESVSHDSQVALLPYESCSLATPVQGQNKTPRDNLLINGSTVSTGYSAPVGIQESTLPADWYLPALLSLTVLTKILRFVETLQRVSKSAEVGP